MAKETNRLNIHVGGCEFEVHVPKEKEQIYLMAAEWLAMSMTGSTALIKSCCFFLR